MTEPPPEPRGKPSDITRLLFKAVKGLPEDEQRAIFEYLFEKGIGKPAHPSSGEGADSREGALTVKLLAAQRPVGPDQVMIPVRLSEAQHRRLKQWCAENNFPMAVVVRGVIERFLDSWDKRSS